MIADEYVPLREASKLLPGKVSIATLHRWRKYGLRGVRLETILCGGRRYVARSAIEDFLAKITAAADGTPAPVRTPAQRQREILAAEKELAAIRHSTHCKLRGKELSRSLLPQS